MKHNKDVGKYVCPECDEELLAELLVECTITNKATEEKTQTSIRLFKNDCCGYIYYVDPNGTELQPVTDTEDMIDELGLNISNFSEY